MLRRVTCYVRSSTLPHFKRSSRSRQLATLLTFRSEHARASSDYVRLLALSLSGLGAWVLSQPTADCFSLPKPHDDGDDDVDDAKRARQRLPLTRNFVADVVEAVSPSVVNIMVPGFLGGSSGSGFIVDRDGYIVTNAHVVAQGGDQGGHVVVTMKSGRKRRAVIHAMDVKSDIAVLKLDDMDDEILPVAPLGQSSKIRSGEFVIAIGSPMLLQNSASLGIISATARHASELGLSNNRSEYLQTDAAVNVGNSGGPLVNIDGEVIGINTLKVKGTDGISLAIPIDIASQIIKQLIATKTVTRPYVGLKMAHTIAPSEYSTNKAYRRKHGYPSEMFVEPKITILEVQPYSPAAKCGLQSGDVILGVNDKDAKSVRDVLDAIGFEVGAVLKLKIQRGDRIFSVSLVTAPETAPRSQH